MRVGELVHPSTAELFVNRIVGDGMLRYQHPRCGRVVIERQADGAWLITKVEKPDPAPDCIHGFGPNHCDHPQKPRAKRKAAR